MIRRLVDCRFEGQPLIRITESALERHRRNVEQEVNTCICNSKVFRSGSLYLFRRIKLVLCISTTRQGEASSIAPRQISHVYTYVLSRSTALSYCTD